MMLHVMNFPGCERPVQHGIDPGMTLPSTDPRREVVDSTEGGNAQRYTVHAGLEHLVTAVADDRQHMFVPLLSSARRMPRLTVSRVVCFRPSDNSDLSCEFGFGHFSSEPGLVDRGSPVGLTQL